MLGLKLETDPRWVDIASKTIEEILIDHAWCEQKAASSGISLIILFPEKREMVEEVSQIVGEEWGHFERVLNELKKRGFELGPARKDEYVIQLAKLERKGGSRNTQLMEKLLQAALIEARSCERFKLLYEGLTDPDLKKFYYEFMVSEAGHYVSFVDLAKKYHPEKVVKDRLAELLQQEAEIIRSLELRSDRVH
ncbi:MAG TPA: tRNA-(ms[2]io[6]A)-hydroxylase [Catalimonadaceae bacterium]|jgi:tRNA-(ms[2]io[6]A)-hydroxylase|nr:tRNA-(ms[2]io[6]A)-hydroxylase [Catalimonadaceae bacterium]